MHLFRYLEYKLAGKGYCIAFAKGISNTHPPGQNGRHFSDDIFKCIFMNEKFCDSIQVTLKFVPKGPIDNNPALV